MTKRIYIQSIEFREDNTLIVDYVIGTTPLTGTIQIPNYQFEKLGILEPLNTICEIMKGAIADQVRVALDDE